VKTLEPGSLADRLHAKMMGAADQPRSAIDLARSFDVNVRLVVAALEEYETAGFFVRKGTNWLPGTAPVTGNQGPAPRHAVPFTDLPGPVYRTRMGTKAGACITELDKLTEPGLAIQGIEGSLRVSMEAQIKHRHRDTMQRYALRREMGGSFGVYRLPDAEPTQTGLKRVA
jgi:hypothetical protein